MKIKSGTPSKTESPKSELRGRGCSLHLQNQDGVQKFRIWLHQRPATISKSRPWCQTSVRDIQHPPNPQVRIQWTWTFFALSKSREGSKILNMGVSKTSDHIQINIKVPNPSQESLFSSKVLSQDVEDIDFLCAIKMKIKSKNAEHGCIKDW